MNPEITISALLIVLSLQKLFAVRMLVFFYRGGRATLAAWSNCPSASVNAARHSFPTKP
jgi:hypothetical protein